MKKQQTVLLTGASGFIAKHIALKLLNAGYIVVGSLRSLSRAQEVRDAVTPHLSDPQGLDERLKFVALDLSQDAGWPEAMAGVDILMHTASPFPLAQPKNEGDLIRPAVDGALRALRAAHSAGIRRVVMTSSGVAVMEGDLAPGQTAYDETNWSDMNRPRVTPYTKSKTFAERAAWDFVRDEAPEISLTVINPVLVTGAPLDTNFGTSVSVIQRVLRARDPMLPNIGFPLVDVQDVAEMHLRVLSAPETAGQRLLAVHSFVWFVEIAHFIKSEFPDRRIVTRVAPNFMIRLLAIFDKPLRTILPSLGRRTEVSGARAASILGMKFKPAETSILETARFLIENDQVN